MPSLEIIPHAMAPEIVADHCETSVDNGLSAAEVTCRRAKYGANRLAARQPVRKLVVLLHQFQSSVVLLLTAAAIVSMAVGEWKEGTAIWLVLMINAAIGFTAELRAARSMEALRSLGNLIAQVRRDGKPALVPAEDLVPGDVVILKGGDIVTADLRLIETSNLSADEAALTGESVPVDKTTAPVAADSPIADRTCMAFKGTAITRGSGLGIVVGTGMETELGLISKLVNAARTETSPLERQLQRLGGQLIRFTLIIVIILGAIGVAQGQDVTLMIKTSIALAVAAIPEGVPVVATLALARGMWRMARHNALIEQLSAVETLGGTTIILTDKTGTLTENRMQVQQIACADAVFTLSGTPGRFHPSPTKGQPEDRDCLDPILTASLLCNNAVLDQNDEHHIGDPMEQALLAAARTEGLDPARLRKKFPRNREIAFDSTSKLMATVHRCSDDAEAAFVMWVKGAPEAVLAACSSFQQDQGQISDLTAQIRAGWAERTDAMAANGMRVLAVATRPLHSPDVAAYSDLIFLGLIGLYDPPRPDVPEAIAQCCSAGIRVVMLTGDHAVTAVSIAAAVGLSDADPVVVEGRNLRPIADMSEEELSQIRRASVFARVSPAQKLELVKLFQRDGHIVAMTGDGVNDAPALKHADIGVAMGKRGTQVAREAAAMVLRDDAFGSIVAAIREGRVILRNIQRFVTYLLSCNLSEVLVVGVAVLVGLPLPLMPLQILFLNLVTDVFPAFALAAGDGSDGILNRPPRDPKKPIMTRQTWIAIVAQSLWISTATLGAFVLARTWLSLDEKVAVTVSFLTLAFAQLFHVFNMRSAQSGILVNEITRNKFIWLAILVSSGLLMLALYLPVIATPLDLEIPGPEAWMLIAGMSLIPLLAGRIVKIPAP